MERGRAGGIRLLDELQVGNAGDVADQLPQALGGNLAAQLHGIAGGEDAAQVFQPVEGHQPALVDDQHLVADRLDLREDVGADDHGVVLPQVLDQRPHFDDLGRVQAHGRLVQDDDLRVADQGLGDAHPLAVALGQVLDQLLADLLDVGLLDGPLDLRLHVPAAQALGPGHEMQVFIDRLLHVQGRPLRQVAHQALGLPGLLKNVVAADLHLAGRGGQTSGHDVHGGGFSRAVWPQESVYLSRCDGEGQIGHGLKGAVSLRQVLYFNQVPNLLFMWADFFCRY